ncbi:MAG: hypothetical protein CMH26_00280 [Micavibrio sp.]|nr:hypothetical protein [Micavibrio sp.]
MTMITNTPEGTPNYQKAAGAYQNTSEQHINGFEIVRELYKGMISNIEQAKDAYNDNRLEEMCLLNQKTFKILMALQSHLNFEQGGDAATFLNNFYNSIFVSLTRVLRADDTAQEFDNIIERIEPVYKRWCTFAADSRESELPQ